MKLKIVKLEIKDKYVVDNKELLDFYYLVNPDKKKLAELKHMVEHRFDYMYEENISDEEIMKAEELVHNIWEAIIQFINNNFVVLKVNETYKIEY